MDPNEYRIMYELEQSYWWFKGKQYLLKSFLRRYCEDIGSGDKVLDAGCGTGINLKILNEFASGYGLDFSQYSLSFLKKRGLKNILCADLSDPVPFKDSSFSALICLDLLEHVDDDLFLLKEFERVLKPGGKALITVPAFKSLWSHHDEVLHHRRRYRLEEVLEKVRCCNFRVLKNSYFNSLLFIPILLVRKINSLKKDKNESKTDLNIKLPLLVNRLLQYLFIGELFFLRYLKYPFGVSIVLILQKKTR